VVKRHETAGVSTSDCLPLSVQGVSGSEATAQNSEQFNCSKRQVSSGTPAPLHGSSKFLCGFRTLLLLLHTASLLEDSNFRRSKKLRPHRSYLIIRSKKYVITQIQTLRRNLLRLPLQTDASGSSNILVRVGRNTRRGAPQNRNC
jgi:hypothetical protein